MRVKTKRKRKTRVGDLRPEDIRRLLRWWKRHVPRRSRKLDVKRTARIPVYVETWKRHPTRYDIPGIDTPPVVGEANIRIKERPSELARAFEIEALELTDHKVYEYIRKGYQRLLNLIERHPRKLTVYLADVIRERKYHYADPSTEAKDILESLRKHKDDPEQIKRLLLGAFPNYTSEVAFLYILGKYGLLPKRKIVEIAKKYYDELYRFYSKGSKYSMPKEHFDSYNLVKSTQVYKKVLPTLFNIALILDDDKVKRALKSYPYEMDFVSTYLSALGEWHRHWGGNRTLEPKEWYNLWDEIEKLLRYTKDYERLKKLTGRGFVDMLVRHAGLPGRRFGNMELRGRREDNVIIVELKWKGKKVAEAKIDLSEPLGFLGFSPLIQALKSAKERLFDPLFSRIGISRKGDKILIYRVEDDGVRILYPKEDFIKWNEFEKAVRKYAGYHDLLVAIRTHGLEKGALKIPEELKEADPTVTSVVYSSKSPKYWVVTGYDPEIGEYYAVAYKGAWSVHLGPKAKTLKEMILKTLKSEVPGKVIRALLKFGLSNGVLDKSDDYVKLVEAAAKLGDELGFDSLSLAEYVEIPAILNSPRTAMVFLAKDLDRFLEKFTPIKEGEKAVVDVSGTKTKIFLVLTDYDKELLKVVKKKIPDAYIKGNKLVIPLNKKTLRKLNKDILGRRWWGSALIIEYGTTKSEYDTAFVRIFKELGMPKRVIFGRYKPAILVFDDTAVAIAPKAPE